MFSIGDDVEIISPQSPLKGLVGKVVGGPNATDVYEVELDNQQLLPSGWHGGYLVSVKEQDLCYYLNMSVQNLPNFDTDFFNELDQLFEPTGDCECGGDACKSTHSHWCPKYKPYK